MKVAHDDIARHNAASRKVGVVHGVVHTGIIGVPGPAFQPNETVPAEATSRPPRDGAATLDCRLRANVEGETTIEHHLAMRRATA